MMLSAIAYINKQVFDDFVFCPDNAPGPASSQQSDHSADNNTTPCVFFELRCDALLECLNVFGTAGSVSATSNAKSNKKKYRGWRKLGQGSGSDSDDGGGGGASARSGQQMGSGGSARIDQSSGGQKPTGLRMSYEGEGHPLTLLV